MPRILYRLDHAPPPLLAIVGDKTMVTLKHLSHDGEDERSSSPSSSAITAVIIIASAIILSSSFYLLLRCVTRHYHRSLRTLSAVDDFVFPSRSNNQVDSGRDCGLVDPLPIFSYGSVTGNSSDGGDCAVCLSKFEANDQLRLLPLCCHAFHVECIDAWLSSNKTCPLCRSAVYPTDEDVMEVILSSEEPRNSFLVEIGSVSRRPSNIDASDGRRSSYSIGAFDYIVDAGYEVSVGSTYRRRSSVDKEMIGILGSVPATAPEENLVAEVSGRSWLTDYVDQLASISSPAPSFRISGEIVVDSIRRSNSVVVPDDLEANRIGENISEFFRWFSGI